MSVIDVLDARFGVAKLGLLQTVFQLPSYSPDDNPLEKLWQKVKEKGTHLHYFPTFDHLKNKVEESLFLLRNAPKEMLTPFVQYNKLA